MILIVSYLVGLLSLLLVVLYFAVKNKPETIDNLIGPLSGLTCKEQTFEVLQAVLDTEVLFDLVKEVGFNFSGFEHIDIEHINTSKFAKLVSKYNGLPTQITSAERYFRTFKNEYYFDFEEKLQA